MSGRKGHLSAGSGAPAPTSRRGQGAVAALAGLLAVVLLIAVAFAALRSGTENADTVLEQGRGAALVLPDGTSRPAVEGERVPRGATVEAGTAGAVLQTRDRRTYLGQATAVTVRDGARQWLRKGYVMVDATDAPGLELATDAAVVEAAEDSLVRVVAGPLVRVGVLRGASATVRATGRRASTDVPRYYQAQVASGGLPSAASPLLLVGDRFERDLARELYDADRDLNALARRLDTAGAAGPAVLSVLRATVSDLPAGSDLPVGSDAPAGSDASARSDLPVVDGAPDSERALGFLLARAVAPAAPAPAYVEVRGLRTAGGSWGVVAAIVGASPNDVSGALGELLAAQAPVLLAATQPAPVPVPGLFPGLLPGSLTPAPGSAPATTAAAPDLTAPPAAGAPAAGPAAPPGSGPRPGDPGPVPVPVPPPPTTGVPVIDEVVDTVLDVIDPSRAPAPVPAPVPTAPAPVPAPVPTAPALVPTAPAPVPALAPLLPLVLDLPLLR